MRLSRTAGNIGLILPAVGLLGYGALRLNARPVPAAGDKAIIGKQTDGTYFVPTGQTLAPAGRNLAFDGRPVDMALRPDGKVLAVMLGSEVKFLDTATGEFQPDVLPG